MGRRGESEPVGASLRELMTERDAARFVGRVDELDEAVALATGGGTHRVLYVHGPAGIGKSAFLRALERQGSGAGRPVVRLDGRMVDAQPDALLAALDPWPEDGTIVIIDEVDELAPIRFELRALAARLPASCSLILAGRMAPGREWFEAGFEHLTRERRLPPLDLADSRRLLEQQGVTDPGEIDRLVQWSLGYPLALTLAAASRGEVPEGGGDTPTSLGDDGSLAALLLSRLTGRELDDVDPDALDAAAIAPTFDGRLLAAVLPGRPTRAMLTQLRELSVVEPVGNAVGLHRLVRTAVRDRLRSTDPEQYRSLVLAVAEHLWSRCHDEPRLMYQIADLVENPGVILGFGPSTTYFGDHVRPGDSDVLAAHLGVSDGRWWQSFLRWCTERPEQVMVIRESAGRPVFFGVVATVANMPDWAEDDIETGPVIRHARQFGSLDQTITMSYFTILHDPTDLVALAEINRVGNLAAAVIARLVSPVRTYVTQTARREGDGAVELGYQEVPELARRDGERELLTLMADFGPAGLVGALYGMVRAEQGAPAVEGTSEPSALMDALRAFRDDEALRHSPLAGPTGDAALARAEVRRAIRERFGASESDRLLRAALERTYLDPDGGHAAARNELHMSRSSFYRHLQRARDRLSDLT